MVGFIFVDSYTILFCVHKTVDNYGNNSKDIPNDQSGKPILYKFKEVDLLFHAGSLWRGFQG